MVSSAEKKPKTTKKEIPKQPKRLNSSAPPTAAKKSTKKGPKEKLSYILINKSSEDFNDSSDFVIPQNKQKAIKNEKSPTELSNATSREPKKKRSQSCSSEEAVSVVRTSARRRTRSSEQQFQEAERNRESVTDESDLSKISSTARSLVKETLSLKSLKGGSHESKKQILYTSKAKKVKVEPTEKDEKEKRTPAKKLTKSELVKSSTESASPKLKNVTTVGDKDEQPKNKRTYKPRKKSSESSDILNSSQKSTEVPNGEKVRNKSLDKNSAKSLKKQPSKKVTPKSSEQDSIPSKCTPKKTVEKEKDASGKKDMSPLLPTAMAKKSPPNSQLLIDKKERNDPNPCQSSTVKCPTCKELIPEELLGRHILMCLKKKYEAKAKVNHVSLLDQEQLYKDEVLARQIHDDINRETVDSKESADTEEINFCHLCLKDLTHMNSFWKMKHINNCFDDAEKKNASKQTKVAPIARQPILSCPMCGKQFKTGPMRRCHLKKCAQELSFSPEDALKLIAKQEKDFKESIQTTTAAAAAGPSSTSTRSVRNKTNKFPDEQMQVAMAMSSSLFAEQEKLNEALTETVKNINQGVNRELRKLKRSQKKASASTPLLLTISKEEQLMRNAQRVESIISQPAHAMNFSRPFPRSSLSMSCGDVYHLPEDNPSSTSSFWSRASLTASSLTADSFYVQALMPQIKVNTVIAGSRLKPLSAIPGRGLDQDETVSTSPPPNDSLIPSTQTAVLLAELAQLNDDELDDGENSDNMMQQSQGFYSSQVTTPPTKTQENEAVSTLLEDFSSLINNPQFSDVELLAADSLRVYAHRNLLSVRCPQILNLAVTRENSWVIEMKDVSQKSLLAFLRYLYAGRLDFERNVTADLLELSREFDLPQLASRCEKLLQVLIDEACYTPSVESVASDAHEPLEMHDIQLRHNEKDDKKDDADTNDCDDFGIHDQPSEELLPLFIASPPKISRDSTLPISPKISYQESQAPKRFMEFSPKLQDKKKVEIPISKSNCSESNGSSLGTTAEQIVSALTWQEELQDKELIPSVSNEIESEKIPTSFMGLLSGKSVSKESNKDKNSNFCKGLSCLSEDPGLRVIPSEACPSKSVLARTNDKENAEILSKECSGSSILVSCDVSNSGFDDSNELFSGSEDFEEESIAIKDSGDNGKKSETKSVSIVESLEVFNDSICFVSENQRNLPGISMSSTALHLADTVCENSLDEDFVSKGETFKALSPANQSSQIPNCTLLNVNTTSIHMADTVLEPDKNSADSVNSPCLTPRSAHSRTHLQESVSKSSEMSPKNTHKFSPYSLSGRFDSANQNTRTDFGTDLEVNKSPSGLSKSPGFSFPPLNRSKSDSGVIDMHENSFNDRTHYQPRKKRKSCDMEMTPLPKRSRRKTLHANDMVCMAAEDGLNGSFAGSPLRKETGLESPIRSEKTLVAFGNRSDLVSEDFCSPSKSIMIPSDHLESSENLLNNSQTKNSEERFEISDDHGDYHSSHSDFEFPLTNSSGNLEAYSRLSEDNNVIEHTSDQFKRIDMSSEQDSDLETVSDTKDDKSIDAKLVKNSSCLPENDTRKTGRHKKKFTFKRTQLKNVTSPVVCPVRTVSPPVCCSSTKKDPFTPKYTSFLKRSSEDHAEFSDTVESDCDYQSAVWNDFEDNGYIADFAALSSSSSPARQNASPTEFMIAKKLDCEEGSRLVSPRTSEVIDKTAENESLNESFIYDFICSSSPIMSQTERSPDLSKDLQPGFSVPLADRRFDLDKSKTPLTLKKRVRRKEPTVPSPFTPMPTYTHMTTPELEQKLKKHGCRKMNRKKMVTLLEEIYHKSHQYETDSEMEQSLVQVDVSSQQPHDSHNVSLQTRSKAQDLFLRSHNEKSSPFTQKNLSKKPGSKIFEKGMNPVTMDRFPTLTISPQSELLNFDDDDDDGLVSDTGDAVGAYEESFMANDEDIPSSQPQASSDNLHDRLRAFVQKNPEIYTKILFYEPIDFDQLKKKVFEAKIKCSATKLLGFLDNQCITFAMNKERQHHGTRKPRGGKKKL